MYRLRSFERGLRAEDCTYGHQINPHMHYVSREPTLEAFVHLTDTVAEEPT